MLIGFEQHVGGKLLSSLMAILNMVRIQSLQYVWMQPASEIAVLELMASKQQLHLMA